MINIIIKIKKSLLSKNKYVCKLSNNVKDALELAREEDTPRDMEMRFLLSRVVDKLESFRYENPDYLTSV